MRGINEVILGGNLGKTPEIKYLQDGMKVASFQLAINKKWRSSGGEIREKTDWFKVVAYRKLADNCEEYLSGGDSIVVIGALSTREWDDKESGQKRRVTEVVARSINFVRIKKHSDSKGDESSGEKEPGSDGDVPF